MADLDLSTLKAYTPLFPMLIKKYEQFVPDQNASVLDKINSIIAELNAIGQLSNNVVKDWNTVYQWCMNDGLQTDVNNKLEDMRTNGEISDILNNIFDNLTGDMTTLHTAAKDKLVNSINEVDDLAKLNQTNIGDLTTLTTNDKGNLVAAINNNVASLAENAYQGVSVHSYGAVGDGVTDDTQAFQNAINYAKNNNIRRVYAPNKYLLNSTLDLTNLMTNGITIEGNNMSYAYGYGSEIILNTGGIGIDCTGSSRVVLKNLKITSRTSGLTNPSKIGILFGRSTVNTVTGNCKLDNCDIDMHSDWTANGGNGTIAIYNFATEVFKIDKSELKGDIPIVFTQTNIYNIQSVITTTNPYNSSNTMTVVEVVGSMLTSRKSYGCIMENLGEAVFKVNADCFPSDGSTKGTATFRLEGTGTKNIRIDEIHSEAFNKFIELNGVLNNFDFSGMVSGMTDRVIEMMSSTAQLRFGKINLYVSIDRTNFPSGSTSLIYNSYTGDYQLETLDINIGSSVQIYAPNQRLTSTKIHSSETVANTVINVKTNSKYDLSCWDGVPSCDVKSSAIQPITASTYTKVTFDTVNSNTGMYSSSATDRVTIQKPGIYTIDCYVPMGSPITGQTILSILKNSTAITSESKNCNGEYPRFRTSATIQCNINDVLQIEFYHTNASAVNIAVGCNLRITRVAP